jgi:hypothetical protein
VDIENIITRCEMRPLARSKKWSDWLIIGASLARIPVRTLFAFGVALALTGVGSFKVPVTIEHAIGVWAVLLGAVSAGAAWIGSGGGLRRLLIEQRPVLGAFAALMAYVVYAAGFSQPTSTVWAFIVVIGGGACCGRLLAMTDRVGEEVFRVDSPPATNAVTDAIDRRIWSRLVPVALFCGMLRAVRYLTAVMTLMRG